MKLLLVLLLVACNAPRGVVLWHAYNGDERIALEATAAAWNAAHPDQQLTLVAVPYDAFADKLSSAIPRGNGPDLFIYPQDRIGDWADAGDGMAIEITSGIAAAQPVWIRRRRARSGTSSDVATSNKPARSSASTARHTAISSTAPSSAASRAAIASTVVRPSACCQTAAASSLRQCARCASRS